MNTPVRPAQGALAVRSMLYVSIAAAADRVWAVPAVWRCTRARIPRGPRRAERLHAHGAVLARPQRIGWSCRHPPQGEAPRAGHRAKSGKRSGSLAKRMKAVLVKAGHPHVPTVSPCGVD